MKGFRVFLLIEFLLFGTACYGAVSDDVYVRKDVFEVYMKSINDKLDMILDEQKAQRNDIKELSNRMSRLEGRMDGLDKRIDDLRNGIYLWLVIIGLVASWPKARKVFQNFGKSTPSITLEDVKRLIEENNMKLSGKAQA